MVRGDERGRWLERLIARGGNVMVRVWEEVTGGELHSMR